MASKFQQRHYEVFALLLQRQREDYADDIAALAVLDIVAFDMADMFRADNAHFKADRFLSACEPGANIFARNANPLPAWARDYK